MHCLLPLDLGTLPDPDTLSIVATPDTEAETTKFETGKAPAWHLIPPPSARCPQHNPKTKPKKLSATRATDGGHSLKLKGPPVRVEIETLKSKIPIKWAVGQGEWVG